MARDSLAVLTRGTACSGVVAVATGLQVFFGGHGLAHASDGYPAVLLCKDAPLDEDGLPVAPCLVEYPGRVATPCYGDRLALEFLDARLTDGVEPMQTNFPPFRPVTSYVTEAENPIVLWPFTKRMWLSIPRGRMGTSADTHATLHNDSHVATFEPHGVHPFREYGWDVRDSNYVLGFTMGLVDAFHDYRLFGETVTTCAESDNPHCLSLNEPPITSCTFPVRRGLYVSTAVAVEDYEHSDPLYVKMHEPVLGGVAVVVSDPDVWIRVRVRGEIQTLHYQIASHEKVHVLYAVPPDVSAEYTEKGCAASARTAALPICRPAQTIDGANGP